MFANVKQRLRSMQGFTMIEMVAVLVLVAILAALAIPAYRDHINNVRRREGEAALYTILTAAKTYYYRNGDSFTGSTCPDFPAVNNIWLNTAEICNHWGINYDGTAGSSVTIRVDGNGDYAGLCVELGFDATNGTTTIDRDC